MNDYFKPNAFNNIHDPAIRESIKDSMNFYLSNIFSDTAEGREYSDMECFSILFLVGQMYQQFLNTETIDSYIDNFISHLRPRLNQLAYTGSISLFGGLSDFGISLRSINVSTGKYKKLLASVEKTVAQFALHKALLLDEKIGLHSVTMYDYDCISGLSGILRFLLYAKSDLALTAVKKVLETLISLSRASLLDGKYLPNWCIFPGYLLPDDKPRYPGGMLNLGVAHGIGGPLSAISIAQIHGICIPGQKDAILRYVDFYKSNEHLLYNGLPHWDASISVKEYHAHGRGSAQTNRRLGWCYGAIGILRSLQLASKALSSDSLITWSNDKLSLYAELDLSHFMLDSPTICHGYAGALLIFAAAYDDTHIQVFSQAAMNLHQKIREMYSQKSKYGFTNIEHLKDGIRRDNTTNFLSGATGSLLALITPFQNHHTVYEHLLIK